MCDGLPRPTEEEEAFEGLPSPSQLAAKLREAREPPVQLAMCRETYASLVRALRAAWASKVKGVT